MLDNIGYAQPLKVYSLSQNLCLIVEWMNYRTCLHESKWCSTTRKQSSRTSALLYLSANSIPDSLRTTLRHVPKA